MTEIGMERQQSIIRFYRSGERSFIKKKSKYGMME
jgi:hypothetical protein